MMLTAPRADGTRFGPCMAPGGCHWVALASAAWQTPAITAPHHHGAHHGATMSSSPHLQLGFLGNHLLLAHSLHRDGALDCGRRTVRGEGRVSDRRASGGRRGARGRARVQGLSPRGRIPDAIEIDVFFRASAVRARAGTHREARTCGRCSCARPPWRGRRRRSWRRRWRPFSLGGVAVGGAERCVCEYARARAGRPGSATWNERRAFAAFHWTTHIETRIGPIAWGARVRTLGGRVT